MVLCHIRRPIVAAALAFSTVAVSAGASWAGPEHAPPRSPSIADRLADDHSGPVVGGFVAGWLPADVGDASLFESETDDGVELSTAVWESRGDLGGWRVDGQLSIARGAQFSSPEVFRDWVVSYQERAGVELVETTVHGRRAWTGGGQILWLQEGASVAPELLRGAKPHAGQSDSRESVGVGIIVSLDSQRWSTAQLRRLARSVHPAGWPRASSCFGG